MKCVKSATMKNCKVDVDDALAQWNCDVCISAVDCLQSFCPVSGLLHKAVDPSPVMAYATSCIDARGIWANLKYVPSLATHWTGKLGPMEKFYYIWWLIVSNLVTFHKTMWQSH